MKHLKQIFPAILIGMMLGAGVKFTLFAQADNPPANFPTLAATPVFRYPVVDQAEVSGYFDHDDRSQVVTFYDGRSSQSSHGFLFTCPALDKTAPGAGNSWVGCEIAANGEAGCPAERQLWYDNHRGLDYEYAPNWYTGAQCNPTQFDNLNPPIYAPAEGLVDTIGEGHPFNGNFIVLYHDLNGDGNFYNDGLRSYYLHFAANGIMVDEGTTVKVGDLLGYGDMSGLAWTPHLHFEVHRRTENGWQPVDPYGWMGSTQDPWITPNHPLWHEKAPSTTQ
jgi:murein DD-endopeptidase MepM/ murein hydrolase activator NlpD